MVELLLGLGAGLVVLFGLVVFWEMGWTIDQLKKPKDKKNGF